MYIYAYIYRESDAWPASMMPAHCTATRILYDQVGQWMMDELGRTSRDLKNNIVYTYMHVYIRVHGTPQDSFVIQVIATE